MLVRMDRRTAALCGHPRVRRGKEMRSLPFRGFRSIKGPAVRFELPEGVRGFVPIRPSHSDAILVRMERAEYRFWYSIGLRRRSGAPMQRFEHYKNAPRSNWEMVRACLEGSQEPNRVVPPGCERSGTANRNGSTMLRRLLGAFLRRSGHASKAPWRELEMVRACNDGCGEFFHNGPAI
jgi:hypothetical protein